MTDTANLQVNADALIRTLRDKLGETILQVAILETAVAEAQAREALALAAVGERDRELAALRPAKEGSS